MLDLLTRSETSSLFKIDASQPNMDNCDDRAIAIGEPVNQDLSSDARISRSSVRILRTL